MAVNMSVINNIYTITTKNYSFGYKAVLKARVLSQSITTNSSRVQMLWYMLKTGDDYGNYNMAGSSYVELNLGSSTNREVANFDGRAMNVGMEKLISDHTFDIDHDDDGQLTVTMDGEHDTNVPLGTVQLTATSVVLPRIATASDFTIVDSTIYIGTPLTINIARKSTSFTHKVIYSVGTYSQEFNGIATTHTFTPPLSWINYIKNSTIDTNALITVETYSGSTYIGGKLKKWSAYVPTNVVPTLQDIDLTPETILFNDDNLFIKTGYIIATIQGATGAYSSTITGNKISSTLVNGQVFSYSPARIGIPYAQTPGNVTFTGEVTDSRGRKASKSKAITIVDYSQPQMARQVYKVNEQNEEDDTGTRILVRMNTTYLASVNGLNSWEYIRYRWRIQGDFWSNYIEINADQDYYIENINPDIRYEVETSYRDSVMEQDGTVHSFEIITTINPSVSIMDILANGNGMAIGKIAELDDTLEVGYTNFKANNVVVESLMVGDELVPTIESGTWTPDSTAGSISSISNSYFYKMGRLVKFNSNFNFTSVTSSAAVVLTGLPHRAYSTMIDVRLEFSTASNTLMVIRGYLVGDQITFRYQGNTGSTGNLFYTLLPQVATPIQISGTYITEE